MTTNEMQIPQEVATTYRRLYERKIRAFRHLYEFTFHQCGACVESGCACKDRICQHVEERALEKGVKLQRSTHKLRFIGEKGCVVEPHLRETCTIYLCGPAQTRKGFATETYVKIRRICDRLDWRLMEIEEKYGRDLVRRLGCETNRRAAATALS
jgi:hypothetical protein